MMIMSISSEKEVIIAGYTDLVMNEDYNGKEWVMGDGVVTGGCKIVIVSTYFSTLTSWRFSIFINTITDWSNLFATQNRIIFISNGY